MLLGDWHLSSLFEGTGFRLTVLNESFYFLGILQANNEISFFFSLLGFFLSFSIPTFLI